MKNIIGGNQKPIATLHKAFPYQREAFEEIKDLPYAAIFHEQGLGKTKIAVDLLKYWIDEREIDTVFIITKKQLVENWKRELAFHTGITPSVLTSDAVKNYYVLTGTARVIVTNFEAVVSEKSRLELFLKTREVAVIVDESAKMKNPKTKLTQTLFALRELFAIRVIMTGTPIANRPYDIWAQVYFLDGGVSLGRDFEDFKKHADLSNDLAKDAVKQSEFADEVGGIYPRISAFSVRETKDGSSVISLPSKTIHDVEVEFEPLQRVMYEQVRSEMFIVVQQGDESIFDDSSSSLKRMTRLLELASSPLLIDDSYQNVSGKEEVLDELLSDIAKRGEKCIVWSNFTGNIDRLRDKYDARQAVKIHGKMDMQSRNRAVSRFQDGDATILFATPQAAKEGLTLTAANNTIFFDRGFNLDDYLQAQDRIHRISQKKDCHIYNLIMKESIDVWISKLLVAKKNAARLGQGDITRAEYDDVADYTYSDMVKDVLGWTEEHND